MPRPPLPIGSWGRISTSIRQTDKNGKPVSHRSSARFRDHDGQVRPVTAYGRTATAAERALLKKLQDRAKTGQSGEPHRDAQDQPPPRPVGDQVRGTDRRRPPLPYISGHLPPCH